MIALVNPMNFIQNNIRHVKLQMASVTRKKPCKVDLVVVSKGQPLDSIIAAFNAGQTAFGESYAQEFAQKATHLKHLPIYWHYIGRIQSNKLKIIATHAHMVHSIERLSILKKLNSILLEMNKKIDYCIQINIDGSPHKQGVLAADVESFIQAAQRFPAVRLRGFMTILDPKDQENTCADFKKMYELYSIFKEKYSLEILSMGMSDDFEMAIASGATLVRVGRKIFNPIASEKPFS